MNTLRSFLRKCKHTIFSNMKEDLYFREKNVTLFVFVFYVPLQLVKYDGKSYQNL